MLSNNKKFQVLATSSLDSLLDGGSSWSDSNFALPRFRRTTRLFRLLLAGLGIILTISLLIIIHWHWNDAPAKDDYVDLNLIQLQRHTMSTVEKTALLHFATRQLHQPLDVTELREFAQRLRLYRDLLKTYTQQHPDHPMLYRKAEKHKSQAVKELNELQSRYQHIPESILLRAFHPLEPYLASPLLWDLERELFPWAHHQYLSIQEMQQNFTGRGIVIPAGSHHFHFAVHLIRQLRFLGCSLPIVIAHASSRDLKSEEYAFLKRFPGVDLLNVANVIDGKKLELIGWQIKPFALLAAPFQEVILLDADVVLLKDPTFMFSEPTYEEHGVIIFHDRTLFAGDKDKVRWLHQHLPAPLSDRLRATRMYRQVSAHELESGLLVWNKKKRLTGLLAACKLNGKEERERVTYKTFYGDKESFWIGLEMAGESWGELETVPGVIGDSHRNKSGKLTACGRILHFDSQGQPLWFNGGVIKDKHKESERKTLMNFTHFAREGKWEFETSCLDHDVTPINGALKDTLQDLMKLYESQVNLLGQPHEIMSKSSNKSN